MEKRQAYLELLDLINHVLNETELPNDIEWEQAGLLGARHHLIGFVYRGMFGREDVPKEAVARIESGYFSAVGEQTRQEHYATLLFAALRENEIRYMPMTGYVIRRVYPQMSWRNSSDLDVMVDADKLDDVGRILDGFGFTSIRGKRRGKHATYVLDRVVVRVHHPKTEDLWDTLVTDDGMEYRYSDEDFYIRILKIIKKRLIEGTCGIRLILDLHVYRKAKPEMDMTYIKRCVKKKGFVRFEESLLQLADVWFGDGVMTDDMMLLGSYIAASGTLADDLDEERAHALRKVFPRYNTMKRRYPVLGRAKILLPACWVARWFSLLFGRGHDRHAEALLDNTSKRSAKMKKRIKEITGLGDVVDKEK